MLHFLAPLPEQAEPASQQFTDHPDNTREMRQTPVLLAPASPSCGALNRNSTGNLLKKSAGQMIIGPLGSGLKTRRIRRLASGLP
jgi:hypothetical protein